MPGQKVGIDLGTSNVRAFIENKGIVFDEPCVVALETISGELVAIGRRAYEMVGKNPEAYTVVRPLSGGSIVDFEIAERMLTYIFDKICKNKVFKPLVAACMPAGITGLEQRTLLDVFIKAGAGRVCLVEEPLAAAAGAGVMLDKPFGTMLTDIGGGTVDTAVITMGSIALAQSSKAGGEGINKSIADYLRMNRDIIIGERTAEELKMTLGCAIKRSEEIAAISKGKSAANGMPFYFEVSTTEVGFAVREALESICANILHVLELTPPELIKDISESGIIMTGGGSKLYGIDKLISTRTSIKTIVAGNPENAVVNGLGRLLSTRGFLEENGFVFKSYADIAS